MNIKEEPLFNSTYHFQPQIGSTHTYIPNNNIISNPGQTEILSYTLDRNSSDQIGVGSSNSTIESTSPITSWPSMPLYKENPQIQHQPVPSQILQSTIMNIKEEPLFNSTDHFQPQIGSTHTYIPNNNIISNPGQTEILSYTLDRNSSDQIGVGSSNSTIESTSPITPWPSMPPYKENSQIQHQPVPSQILQSTIMNIKEEPLFNSTDHFQPQIGSTHTHIPNNNIISNPGQTEILSYTLDRNSSDQIGVGSSNSTIESTSPITPWPSMPPYKENSQIQHQPVPSQILQSTIMNIKEEPLFNSTDHFQPQIGSIWETYVRREQCNFSISPHNSTANNSPVLSIKQERNSLEKHLAYSNELNVLTASQNSMENNFHFRNIKQEKNLCKNVRERNSSDQVDSVEQAIQFDPIETESNVLDPIKSRNMEHQVFKNLRNRKVRVSLLDDSHSGTIRLNSANKIKYQYDRSTLKKVLPSTSALKVHQTHHSKSQPFSCRYCDKQFSGKGPCTNHEKSHINTIKQNKKNELSSIKTTNLCNLCNRKFTKRCYFTNHMMMKHNIKPNTSKQLTSIDCNKSIILSENIELTNQYKNKLSGPENYENNNLNNHEKKSTFCMFCNTHFAHPGALTNHMRIHGCKTYKCQYCHMQFSRKGLYIMHEKTHVLKNVVKSAPIQNKNNIIYEVNDEPQIEHYNDFEIIHSTVDGNSSGTNLMDIEHLWFPCDVCEKKFYTPIELNVHRKSHSGIVPYVCKICNRSYQLKFRWNQHLKCHYKNTMQIKK
ncbi:zinc finger protein 33A-like [Metopolophium dirhodum]|uniref:zinc finger protein 33A-like n=1 Tax=Metopolophium dirhodum TaxID=44670 RepID=UPI00298FEB4B|nr:zinc finger protein 33A-like [Metopolophium dirhodum]